MSGYLSDPWLVLLCAAYGVGLLYLVRQRPDGYWRRRRLGLALHAAAAVCLLLAAAGLHLRGRTDKLQVVVLADVSDSIVDKETHTARMDELLRALPAETSEVAVAVFAGQAGTERRMAALPAPEMWRARPNRAKGESASARVAPVPDLARAKTQVDATASDIGRGLDLARDLFTSGGGGRGILLLSDFRETRGAAEQAAAALFGSDIDLLAAPAILGQSQDVYLASLRVPETQQLGRAIPIEVVVASLTPCTVNLSVLRGLEGGPSSWVRTEKLSLQQKVGDEYRRSVRIVDSQADSPGMLIYTARVSPADTPLSGEFRNNNELSAAVRLSGSSRWAVLTRPGSTLDMLASGPQRRLGVETQVFHRGALPLRSAAYLSFDGILVDGLSAEELPAAAVRALSEAVTAGKGLVALGGTAAFGAGGHAPEGPWEQLLPVQMTPEDDRTRAVLFVVDVSNSMGNPVDRGHGSMQKIQFAQEELAGAVGKLRAQDRLGLITFSSDARLAAPLALDASRSAFIAALGNCHIEARTSLLAALQTADKVLAEDNSEERLVVLLSDGEDTANTPPEEIIEAARRLCPPARDSREPRRTALYTFGIGIDQTDTPQRGQKMMERLAEAGGGEYSRDFLKIRERLERTFESGKKDFFVRREKFAVSATRAHSILEGSSAWPELSFRNRVKAKSQAQTLLFSQPHAKESCRKPDPLLVLGGSDWPLAGRCAATALSLDGPSGAAWLASQAQTLLPALLQWAEARHTLQAGFRVRTACEDGETLSIEVQAREAGTQLPLNDCRLSGLLTPIHTATAAARQQRFPLRAVAPGVYRTTLGVAPLTIYRLSLSDDRTQVEERFVSTPYSAELRRFGTERGAMRRLLHKAGGGSALIDNQFELKRWAKSRQENRSAISLRSGLLLAALVLVLVELGLRSRRR